MRSVSLAGRLTFAAAMAVSLGVGVQSAFARPAAVTTDAYTCYPGACHRECLENGWASGRCIGLYTGYCECFE
ncbi:hypothetical protein [Longimicrobium sp.]|uniref:hypothetical protein n=1 Tax=Longimicrobium sp. TaxID=2029185 RepID=UPI002E2FF218|nr:hypothetical protein [Longimicrobium sp.]HEX6039408.1 hypothetical protein [Longimicrobium sp.]